MSKTPFANSRVETISCGLINTYFYPPGVWNQASSRQPMAQMIEQFMGKMKLRKRRIWRCLAVCANHFRLLSITRFHLVNQGQICGVIFFSPSYCPRLVDTQRDPYVKPWPCRRSAGRAHRTVSRLRKLFTSKFFDGPLGWNVARPLGACLKQWECRARMVSLKDSERHSIFLLLCERKRKNRNTNNIQKLI